ncbi:RNA-directed DNA polymerase, eukaryota, reverse transcriptase zinc-binding domain protein [Tanacetum coccineum]|uniref:RNA-directed DNA polymerase, eukaryota, reverse transcriptase zinc-binding domain protein n=1 Tax=Tanacetum coccineum TaxID=301880 RepID=A0ABQ5EH46_9ASTR
MNWVMHSDAVLRSCDAVLIDVYEGTSIVKENQWVEFKWEVDSTSIPEALQIYILEACGRGIFAGLSLANDGKNLSLLQNASSLKFNMSKSKLYGIRVDLSDVIDVANSVNCSHGNLPFCYLGLPVGHHRLHGNDGGFNLGVGTGNRKGVWESIVSASLVINSFGIPFRSSFMRNVKSGADVFFWHDIWLGASQCLKDRFPRLYALETHKECRVNDRWISVDGTWSCRWAWHSNPRGRALDDINDLSQLIGSLVLYPGYMDGWIWELDPGGVFTINKLSKLLDSTILGPNVMMVNVDWDSWVPKKVNICVWMALNNHLPTLSNLEARGVPIVFCNCVLCNASIDFVLYCLLFCPKPILIWRKIWSWWKFNPPVFSSLQDLLEFVPPLSSLAKKIFQGVVYVAIWVIWDWRNRVLHTSSSCLHEDIFAKVQTLSLLWLSNRSRKKSLRWRNWVLNPSCTMSIDSL